MYSMFPAFDLGGNSGKSHVVNANPPGYSFLPWPPEGASFLNVQPITCIKGTVGRFGGSGTEARTFKIKQNTMNDIQIKTSGKNTGDKALTKDECEYYAKKIGLKFRVLWDPDSSYGGCWPYCIDVNNSPVGCYWHEQTDEIRYAEIDIPGYAGADCNNGQQKCLQKNSEGKGHDFHHKWRFRKQYKRMFKEVTHSNNNGQCSGSYKQLFSLHIVRRTSGKSERQLVTGKTCIGF